jgi:formylmethanofuran dehydrogenase subunit E
VTEETEQLETQVKDAVRLHGHLGPFLVIGVRIGEAAKRILDSGNQKHGELHASVEVPFQTPFSCTLDGIQSTTHCTIGNRRLKVEESQQEITARFDSTHSDQDLTITVNPEIVKQIMDRISKGTPNEALAQTLVSMPERQLLEFNITRKHH